MFFIKTKVPQKLIVSVPVISLIILYYTKVYVHAQKRAYT